MEKRIKKQMMVTATLALLLAGALGSTQNVRAEDVPAATQVALEAASAESTDGAENKVEEIKTTPATIEDLETLKDVLEEKIGRGVASKSLINLSGSGTLGYYSNSVNQGAPSGAGSFGIGNATLSLTGNLREDPVNEFDLGYRVSLLFSGVLTPTATNNATITQNNTTKNITVVQGTAAQYQTPVLSDVFLTWTLKSAKGQLEPPFTLSAIAGQQLLPFGSDNQATEDKQPTISKALYIKNEFTNVRDIGVTLLGGIGNSIDPPSGITTSTLAYWLGAYNGTGPNRSDTNDSKDIIARLVYSPVAQYFHPLRGLKVGGSYYRGKGDISNKTILRERFGTEFEWLHKPILVTAEAVFGRTGAIHNIGYVGTVFYNPGTLPDFQPLFRYDYYDPNINAKNDSTGIYTIGFNYFFWQTEPVTRRVYQTTPSERVVKLQFNWNIIKKEGVKANATDVSTQLVFSF